jgi:hypothetical protein
MSNDYRNHTEYGVKIAIARGGNIAFTAVPPGGKAAPGLDETLLLLLSRPAEKQLRA